MTKDDRWNHLVALDDELLKGDVILSEWCSLVVREADIAFVHGAHLAAILTAVAGIETYLRFEHQAEAKERLVDLINAVVTPDRLKEDLHKLRRYRNKWVHIGDPWEDGSLLEFPEQYEKELEDMAFFAIRVLRMIIYLNQGV